MASKLISIKHKIDGALADATSVKFQDPTSSYGVRRQDDQTVVLASGTSFTHDGTGLYSREITGLDSEVVYEYYLYIVYNGSTRRFERTFTTDGESTGEGLYAVEADLDDLRGIDNITVWSDLSNTATRNHTRIQKALDWADARIHMLLGNTWTVPLLGLEGTDVTLVKYWSAGLAAYWLYKNRGQAGVSVGPMGQVVNLFEKEIKELENDIWMYAQKRRRFSATPRSGVGTVGGSTGVVVGKGRLSTGGGGGNGLLEDRWCTCAWGGNHLLMILD